MKKSIIVISSILASTFPSPTSAQYYETYCEYNAWRNAVYRCASGQCNTKKTYANIIKQLYPSLYTDPYRTYFSTEACQGKQNNRSFNQMKKEMQKMLRRELGIPEPIKKPKPIKKLYWGECKGVLKWDDEGLKKGESVEYMMDIRDNRPCPGGIRKTYLCDTNNLDGVVNLIPCTGKEPHFDMDKDNKYNK